MLSKNQTATTNVGLKDFIMSILKYNTIQKFSCSLARSKLPKSGSEGYTSSEVLVTSQCDLFSFTGIIAGVGVSVSSVSSETVRLNPSFYNNPPRAIPTLSADFKQPLHLLHMIGVKDPSDQCLIAIKQINTKSNRLLCILASTCVITLSSSHAIVVSTASCLFSL